MSRSAFSVYCINKLSLTPRAKFIHCHVSYFQRRLCPVPDRGMRWAVAVGCHCHRFQNTWKKSQGTVKLHNYSIPVHDVERRNQHCSWDIKQFMKGPRSSMINMFILTAPKTCIPAIALVRLESGSPEVNKYNMSIKTHCSKDNFRPYWKGFTILKAGKSYIAYWLKLEEGRRERERE